MTFQKLNDRELDSVSGGRLNNFNYCGNTFSCNMDSSNVLHIRRINSTVIARISFSIKKAESILSKTGQFTQRQITDLMNQTKHASSRDLTEDEIKMMGILIHSR